MTALASPAAVLALPMEQPNDAGAATIAGYLTGLLACLWEECEGFSGKRPFGNSDWPHDLYRALVAAGLVEGDEDGDVTRAARPTGDELITAAIGALGKHEESPDTAVLREGITELVIVLGQKAAQHREERAAAAARLAEVTADRDRCREALIECGHWSVIDPDATTAYDDCEDL